MKMLISVESDLDADKLQAILVFLLALDENYSQNPEGFFGAEHDFLGVLTPPEYVSVVDHRTITSTAGLQFSLPKDRALAGADYATLERRVLAHHIMPCAEGESCYICGMTHKEGQSEEKPTDPPGSEGP